MGDIFDQAAAQPAASGDVFDQAAAAPHTGIISRALTWLQNGRPPLTKDAMNEMPGSFEGHPENIGEYVPVSAGEMAGGARDVVRGDVSKGLHRVVSGVGNATLPVLPFAAAAAPVATGAAALFGTAGQAAGRGVAKSLGATDDQADLAGDVTGLASGYGGTKVPARKIAQSIGVLSKPLSEAASKLPVVDKVLQAGKTLSQYKNVRGQLSDIWASKQADALGDIPTPKSQPASETGEALGQIPQRGSLAQGMQTPAPPTAIKRGSLSQMLDEQLGKGLGAAPPPNPQAPIYQRGQISSAMQGASDMPAGHTSVQSSALHSYKYDPGANEFHTKYSSGGDTVHVFGDVSPEEAQAFEQAKSKGQAMQTIKNSHPLVAKIVNGKRVDVTPQRGAISQQMQK